MWFCSKTHFISHQVASVLSHACSTCSQLLGHALSQPPFFPAFAPLGLEKWKQNNFLLWLWWVASPLVCCISWSLRWQRTSSPLNYLIVRRFCVDWRTPIMPLWGQTKVMQYPLTLVGPCGIRSHLLAPSPLPTSHWDHAISLQGLLGIIVLLPSRSQWYLSRTGTSRGGLSSSFYLTQMPKPLFHLLPSSG